MSCLNGDNPAWERFPNDAIFNRLQRLCKDRGDVLFHDDYGIDANYSHLIGDIIHLRRILREKLPSSSFNSQGSLRGDAASIAFLGHSGYHFIVSFFAIVALGGICVPLATGLTDEEALYVLNKTKAACILTGSSTFDIATRIKQYSQSQVNQAVELIAITRADSASRKFHYSAFEINRELTFSPTAGCLVLFTSGTTGPPKGVLLPRKMFHCTADVASTPVIYLASCPVHWIGGTGLIDSVLYAENLHIMRHDCGPAEFWEILREGRVTEMSVSPTLLRGLMEYYNENIRGLPDEERDRYIYGAKSLEAVYTSGSALSRFTRKFFTDLANMPLRNGYGITEMGGGVIVTPDASDDKEGYIGKPLPGIEVKLSEGNHGEILVKSPHRFIGYIDDEKATRAAFDDEGFYKTGDQAHRIGDDFYFDGRLSQDWIRFHEYTISVLELEQSLMDLPYVSEAHVLPVPEHEAGGIVAALVRLDKHAGQGAKHDVTLATIREDLAGAGLVSYKLPALLRLLHHEDQVPFTASGKAVKKECLRKYFNITGYLQGQYAVDGVEYWGNKLDVRASSRLFDWGGL